jgi:hypothetical protein
MPKIYRVMLNIDDKPVIGDTASRLGVRVNIDIHADQSGNVRPETGGMSVAPDIRALPARLVPSRLRNIIPGAIGKDENAVWSTGSGPFIGGAVTSMLELRIDPRNDHHGFVEPADVMSLDQYQTALAATRDAWAIDEA